MHESELQPTRPPERQSAPWRLIHAGEDLLAGLALGGILFLPLVGMVLRQFDTALSGGNALTQQLTLFISMAGGAIAARQGSLLTVSQGFGRARAPWGAVFEVLRAGVSAGVSALLGWASWNFLLAERMGGMRIAYDIPVWVPEIALFAGFVIVALRLIHHAGATWGRRAAAAGVAAAVFALVFAIEPETWRLPLTLLALLLVAVVLGAPIFVLLGGAAVFLVWGSGSPLDSLPISQYSLATNPTIPALPLFTLAGYFLSEGGTSRRMIRLLRAVVGDLRAGPAIVTVGACAFFTSLTGASGVTILALGGLLVPFLTQARYSERAAIGLLTGSGSIGLLFAPCLPLILYVIIANQAGRAQPGFVAIDLPEMFLAAAVPGALLAVVCAGWAARGRPAASGDAAGWKFHGRELGAAAWDAKWELLVPVVSLGGIFSGLATPVEAAALTALYALLIETLAYRDLAWRKVPRVLRECGMLIGGVLLILGVAQMLTNYLIEAEVPTHLVAFVQAHVTSRAMFLVLLTLVLLVVGCLMDVFSAIIVVVPLIAPLGALFGIDPVHLGVLFLANLGLGFLTPPVGMSLFLSSLRFKRPLGEVLRASLPYFWLQLAAVVLITFWPALSLALPSWFGF